MAFEENTNGKLSEKKIEEEDSLSKVECLRGRLLAERVASRIAKQEAQNMGNKDNENTTGKEHCAKSREFEFSILDGNSLKSSIEEEEKDEGNQVDNSLALVPMENPKTKQNIDPIVLDATVREVLDALRHAREKLQTQMERRQLIKAS
ncbi:hypothetical protein MTR67_038221 [Solanum verrucosum]|uniref:Uncharacterized protein n=1 Tax=Solanum verrucosum TaxID=315347 RepID=A0AAF0ZMP9_SOLVR|nr:hypothetical protein MTR67_038221 [Solanum verrucosum]